MTKSKVIQARISERLKERFEQALEHDGITASDFIITAIHEYASKYEEEKENIRYDHNKTIYNEQTKEFKTPVKCKD